MRFQIDWASLIVGSKFTVFAVFYFVIGGNFLSTSSRGGGGGVLIFGGAMKYRVFCVTALRGLYLEGLIFGILRYFAVILCERRPIYLPVLGFISLHRRK